MSNQRSTCQTWLIHPLDRMTGEIIGEGTAIYAGRYRIVDHQIVDTEEEKIRQYRRSKYYSPSSDNHFVWQIYPLTDPYLPMLSPGNLARLIYLTTYMSYDQSLSSGKKDILTPRDLQPVLKLSERMTYLFWNEVSDAHLLVSDDNALSFRRDLFRKGRLSSQTIWDLYTQRQCVMKLYSSTVQRLYRSVPPRAHKHLGYIFRALPYVNREYNMVCHNPLEKELGKICPMTAGEFCSMVGYESSNATRLLGQLCDLSLPDGRPLCSKLSRNESGLRSGIIINPHLYYAGQNMSTVLNWLDEKR